MKKTPLGMCALTIMIMALVVIALSFSYIFGLNILPRIIPGVPEAPQLSSAYHVYPRLLISDLILPLFYFFGLLFLIVKSFKDVRAQKHWYGLRPEFGLLGFSLIGIAFSLFILSDYMQPAGSINEYLISISTALCIVTIGVLIGSFFVQIFHR